MYIQLHLLPIGGKGGPFALFWGCSDYLADENTNLAIISISVIFTYWNIAAIIIIIIINILEYNISGNVNPLVSAFYNSMQHNYGHIWC